MFASLVLSIICIVWGFLLIIQARIEMKQSENPIPKQKAQKTEQQDEPKFSGKTLYFSNVPLREREECYLRKKGIFEDMNIIERMECKTAIYWILRFIDKMFLENEKGFFTEKGRKMLTAAKNNVLSMRACFKKEQVQEDLTTVAKLLQYSLENKELSGIFYSHHILSDLNFWILDKPFNEEEFQSWEQKPPKQKETRVFYGITKSWDFSYPRDLQKRIKNIILPEPEQIFDIRSHFAQKYMSLAQTFYTLEEWNIEQMKEYCNAMLQIFDEVISFRAADVDITELNEMEQAIFDKNGATTKGILKYYNMLMMELDRITGFLPECNLHTDFETVREKIQSIYNNQSNIDYPSYTELLSAKRMIEEINRFILPRETDWQENYFYYGATTTMRDVQEDPILNIRGVETIVPMDRDFFHRIIEEPQNVDSQSLQQLQPEGEFETDNIFPTVDEETANILSVNDFETDDMLMIPDTAEIEH